jgi:hypothetical protein
MLVDTARALVTPTQLLDAAETARFNKIRCTPLDTVAVPSLTTVCSLGVCLCTLNPQKAVVRGGRGLTLQRPR